MIAGFTGSQDGISEKQCKELERLFKKYTVTILHHGCCTGADEQAHNIARKLGILITGHPPENQSKLSQCIYDCDFVIDARPYLDRNRDIVDDCEMLFVGPSKPEYLRSGTWSTKRYAKKSGTPFHILSLKE